MSDRYQGDPKMILDEQGSDLVFRGGQPVMDRGLENAALISLQTRPGWAGNILFRKPSEKIGSKYELSLEQPITITSLNTVRNAAKEALQWLLDQKIASKIEVAVSNPTGQRTKTIAIISPLSRDLLILLLTKNGMNWIAQKLDPANLRV